MSDEIVGRIVEDIRDRPRSAGRDIVAHMQCFDADGSPLFTSTQIATILRAVGTIAAQAAEEGDDRRLKRMLDAQLKLATVNAKLLELSDNQDKENAILDRLRDRQRAAGAN